MSPRKPLAAALSLSVLAGLTGLPLLADEPAQQGSQPQSQPAPQPAPQPATQPNAPAANAPAAPAAEPEHKREPLDPITWTDPEIEKISKMLIGNWKSNSPIPEGADPSKSVEVGMSIARVRSKDLADLLYVEAARVDSLQVPFRQAFYQIYRHKNGLRLRTYELVRQMGGSMVGMWLNPDLFPAISRQDVLATIDLDLTSEGDGYSGKSPHPYPNGRLGAVEMTSEATITPDKLITIDRGYDGNGNIVWGAKDDTKYVFSRYEPPIDTYEPTDSDNKKTGVFIIEYRRGTDKLVCKVDDQISVHYFGFLPSGRLFDSSLNKTPPNPLTFIVNEKNVIPGFIQALIGSNVGSVRRAYIPYEQAYGKFGNSRAGIPPYCDVYFDFEVMHLEVPSAEAKQRVAFPDRQTDPNWGKNLTPAGPDGKVQTTPPPAPPAAPSTPPAAPK